MKLILKLFLLGLLISSNTCQFGNDTANAIQPWSGNQWYWQYKEKPVLLLGASSDDNLFQWPSEILIPHLDSMKIAGANYVRNTMSDRQDLGFELYPYKKLENEKYDLSQWNNEYWERFAFFLNETAKRDIIVQIEVWDRFDYWQNNWTPHPYNPRNNINYTKKESGLESDYPDHPGHNKQPFFFTTPAQRNNVILLKYQQKFVDQMLSYTLKHNHILYCMDNETSGDEKWGAYWAHYIRERAQKVDKIVYLTEMWDNWNLKSEQHKNTFDRPEIYDFCDISQNNQQKGQAHWDNFQWVKSYIAKQPRPINTVKTYGADSGPYGSTDEGINRWWRHIIGGVAAARFHRPITGLGLSEPSMNSVKGIRKIEKIIPFWELSANNGLLSERNENEVYLTAKPGEAYVVFFPDGGEVKLNLLDYHSDFSLKWLDVRKGEWYSEEKFTGGVLVNLKTPGSKQWVGILKKNN